MTLYVRDTNTEIIGTLETITGIALTMGIDENGSPEYSGETKVMWDNQHTVMRFGQRVWVDENYSEHLQTHIEEREGTI